MTLTLTTFSNFIQSKINDEYFWIRVETAISELNVDSKIMGDIALEAETKQLIEIKYAIPCPNCQNTLYISKENAKLYNQNIEIECSHCFNQIEMIEKDKIRVYFYFCLDNFDVSKLKKKHYPWMKRGDPKSKIYSMT